MSGETLGPEQDQSASLDSGETPLPDMSGWTADQMRRYNELPVQEGMMQAAADQSGVPGERYVERNDPQPLAPDAITEVPGTPVDSDTPPSL